MRFCGSARSTVNTMELKICSYANYAKTAATRRFDKPGKSFREFSSILVLTDGAAPQLPH
jgi:hypothetical protein